MRAQSCRDSLEVFAYIQEVYSQIREFSFAVYRNRCRAKERTISWQEGENIGELFRANEDEVYLSLARGMPSHQFLARVMASDIGTSWGLFSRVDWMGGVYHIPLLDLTGKYDADVAERVLRCSVFGELHGFILESRKGLHFIGMRLLTATDFERFCGYALLASDLVDKRYVGFSLCKGQFCLRLVTRTGGASHHIPLVVKCW